MDPKAISSGKYFKCEFAVIINASVRVVEYVPNRTYLNYDVAASGTYNNWNNGFLYTQMSKDLTNISHEQMQQHTDIQKAAIDLVYEGYEEFKRYFMHLT